MPLYMFLSQIQLPPGSPFEMPRDVIMAILSVLAHIVYFGCYSIVLASQQMLNALFGWRLGVEEQTDSGTVKVAAIGLSRTGTFSLTLAFEELGIKPFHSFMFPENYQLFLSWCNNVFFPSMEAGKFSKGNPDFDALTSRGFQAVADLPYAIYYEELAKKYPDCKFILTERDPEKWYTSIDMVMRGMTNSLIRVTYFYRPFNIGTSFLRWVNAYYSQNDELLTMPAPLPTNLRKKEALEVYAKHNAHVREVIPADRLLIYNLKDGWKPICDFLEIEECPTTPFPRSNTAFFMQFQFTFFTCLSFATIAWALWRIMSRLLRRGSPAKKYRKQD